MFVFWKIWRALFSWNTRFEIRLFALLPTNSWKKLQQIPVFKSMTKLTWIWHLIKRRRFFCCFVLLLALHSVYVQQISEKTKNIGLLGSENYLVVQNTVLMLLAIRLTSQPIPFICCSSSHACFEVKMMKVRNQTKLLVCCPDLAGFIVKVATYHGIISTIQILLLYVTLPHVMSFDTDYNRNG